MAVQIPHSVHTEIPEEKALRGDQESPWRGVSPVGPTEGVLDRGGSHYAGSCAHAGECAPQTLGIECGGLYQGKERDSHRAALHETREKLRRPIFLGARVLRGHGRPRYRADPAIHRRTRDRRSKARPNGDALD